MYSSVHTHTLFCDGSASPYEMAAAAHKKGIKVFGFSAHTYDPVYDYGLKTGKISEYRAEILRVKKLFEGKMQVLCGVEYDPISGAYPLDGWDYIIGSVHGALASDGSYHSVDHDAETIAHTLNVVFSSDAKALITAYYERLVDFHSKVKTDIIGHFDLVKKANLKMPFFDENASWYKKLTLDAVDAVIEKDRVFEVNTGAVSRGWRDDVYPSLTLLKHIKEKGGRVIITTDTHAPETVDFFYNEALQFVKAAGFEELTELCEDGFVSRPLNMLD